MLASCGSCSRLSDRVSNPLRKHNETFASFRAVGKLWLVLHVEASSESCASPSTVSARENPTSVKARLLLARLSASRGNLPRELLAEEFWGDAELRGARGSLSTELKNLRRTLGPSAELLVATRHQVGLPRREDLLIDIREFAEHIAAERYEDALALWRKFLQETSGTWADAERIRYRRKAARALAALSDARESIGDMLGAADLARQQGPDPRRTRSVETAPTNTRRW